MSSRFQSLRRRSLQATGVALAVLTAGCALGPDFASPAAPDAARFTALPLPERTASSAAPNGEAQAFLAGRPLPDRWWTLFGSPKLDALVEQALAASPTVTSAQAALRVAQETFRVQRATLFPSFDATFDASRQKIDTGSFGNPGGGAAIYNLYNASVRVNYGLDIWGGTRRGIEAQRAATEYQRYQLEATYQTLIANVITTAVRAAEQRLLLLGQEQVIATQESLLKVTRARFESGAIARSELLALESALATERSKLPGYKLGLTQAQNQLAVYLGKLPSEQPPIEVDLYELKLPQALPLSLPSELVRQRPDIRAAEATMHQASANLGVATANLLPQIVLTGSIGTQSSVLDDLFKGNIFSIASSVTQPLLHAGELTAKRRAAIATYDQTAADYRDTVLNAFRNVADSLRALETDAEYQQAQFAAMSTSEQSLRLIESQYRLGAGSYLDVLTAQNQYTIARAGYIVAISSRLTDTAALFQALGGGWTTRDPAADSPLDPSNPVSAAAAP